MLRNGDLVKVRKCEIDKYNGCRGRVIKRMAYHRDKYIVRVPENGECLFDECELRVLERAINLKRFFKCKQVVDHKLNGYKVERRLKRRRKPDAKRHHRIRLRRKR